jgi:hypothetical protein
MVWTKQQCGPDSGPPVGQRACIQMATILVTIGGSGPRDIGPDMPPWSGPVGRREAHQRGSMALFHWKPIYTPIAGQMKDGEVRKHTKGVDTPF